MHIIFIQKKSYDDNKRLMSYDEVTTYPCGIKTRILKENELLSKVSKKY